MADDDHLSLDSALRSVLARSQPINILFEHPEFRLRARRICSQLAGALYGEDLFQEVYLKIQSVPRAITIRKEQDLFSWFLVAARNVHRGLRTVGIKNCTEGRWSSGSGDSSSEIDELIAHAEVCPYHAEILLAEEEEEEARLRSLFRVTRGLDRYGRNLKGAGLRASIAEHKRLLGIRNEAALRKENPFICISLYNGDRRIASCGKFFDFTKHQSIHELDLQPGLQVRGLLSSNSDEEVLLGFYQLVGVRHNGKEQTLPLKNGYKVGVGIKRLYENIYEVNFSYVEDEVAEADQDQTSDSWIGTPEVPSWVVDVGGAPVSRTPSPPPPLADASRQPNVWLLGFAHWLKVWKGLIAASASALEVRQSLVILTNGLSLNSFLSQITKRDNLIRLAAMLFLVGMCFVGGRQTRFLNFKEASVGEEENSTISAERSGFVYQAKHPPAPFSVGVSKKPPNFSLLMQLSRGVSSEKDPAILYSIPSSDGSAFGPAGLFTVYDGATRSVPTFSAPRHSGNQLVATAGPVGGPTSLFTIYDGDTIRKGEFTFSVAYSNYDRDPGDAGVVDTPLSFNVGLNDHLELFFNTNGYRGIKVNNPQNLSSFYRQNSQLYFNASTTCAGAAAILGPERVSVTQNMSGNVFRPAGPPCNLDGPFRQSQFIGATGPNFGLPANNVAPLWVSRIGTTFGGNRSFGSASRVPAIGSVAGSSVPGIVLSTRTTPPNSYFTTSTIPVMFTIAPSYLPDAPFVSRLYGESSFTDLVVGSKIRMSGSNDARVGFIPFYRPYSDKASDFQGFNQLQRGASPGGENDEFGLIGFISARLSQHVNVTANLGNYIPNSSPKSGAMLDGVLLDRDDEYLAVNNNSETLGDVRIDPAPWWGIGTAYRRHTNQQDSGAFNGTPPSAFKPSDHPNGFVFQFWAGHRSSRTLPPPPNQPPTVSVSSSRTSMMLPPREGTSSDSCKVSASRSVNLTANASDPDNDILLFTWSVTGGKLTGEGRSVVWDLSGLGPSTYSAHVEVNDGFGHLASASVTVTVDVCEAVASGITEDQVIDCETDQRLDVQAKLWIRVWRTESQNMRCFEPFPRLRGFAYVFRNSGHPLESRFSNHTAEMSHVQSCEYSTLQMLALKHNCVIASNLQYPRLIASNSLPGLFAFAGAS